MSNEHLERHLTDRDQFLGAIAGELFGPDSGLATKETLLTEPTPFDLSTQVIFEKWEDYNKVRPVAGDSGEEILRDDRPSSRFGMGILFPQEDEALKAEDEERLAAH